MRTSTYLVLGIGVGSCAGHVGSRVSVIPCISSMFKSLSRTFPAHHERRSGQDLRSSQAGYSTETLLSEAVEFLCTRTNSHKLDPSSDLGI